MKIEEIQSLFAYNCWANARLLRVIGSLHDEQLSAEIESSFPSILETIAHIVGAEWGWLRRWKGESPTALPDWLEDPSFEQLSARLADVESERDWFLASLTDEDLERELSYQTLDGTPHRDRLAALFLHLVNHSTYHRGQLTTMLRQVGGTPVATDLVLFERPEG